MRRKVQLTNPPAASTIPLLLMGKRDERTGYSWLEFGRKLSDGSSGVRHARLLAQHAGVIRRLDDGAAGRKAPWITKTLVFPTVSIATNISTRLHNFVDLILIEGLAFFTPRFPMIHAQRA